MNLSDKKVWKRLLEQDPKLKELAIKAGVKNNPKRAEELKGCFALNGGRGVVKSEEERELAEYLFCADFDGSKLRAAINGRIIAARAAGISIDNL